MSIAEQIICTVLERMGYAIPKEHHQYLLLIDLVQDHIDRHFCRMKESF